MNIFRTSFFVATLALTASFSYAAESYGYFAKSIQSAKSSSQTKSAQLASFNESAHFAMHSVMKFPQALYVAHYLDSAKISIDSKVRVVKEELMQNTWSPMLKKLGDTAMISYAENRHFPLTNIAQVDNSIFFIILN